MAMTQRYALLLLLPALACGFYLPGTATDYQDGELVPMDVNVLTSVNTHLPYEYYSIPHCKPSFPVKKNDSDNLGGILIGDRIKRSPYSEVQMLKNFRCKEACAPVEITAAGRAQFEEKISQEYIVQLILDNLPVSVQNPETSTFSIGYPIGTAEKGQSILYNHLEFHCKYHKLLTLVGSEQREVKRVVGFTVRPHSIRHKIDGGKVTSCGADFDPAGNWNLQTTADPAVAFTYSVQWEESAELWATRWDQYLAGGDTEIHWFSIVNSLMIVLFLTGMVAVIMMRTLRRDIARYNSLDDADDLQEETGWKLVHTDVFRCPNNASLLACYTGTGVQIIGMGCTVLLFACLGFLSPANRGALFTAMLLCFVFLGIYGGYTSARLMKMWERPSWRTTALTATLVPGQVFVSFFIINLFVWQKRSSGAVPFGTFVALIALWFCISAPLVFLGSVLGYKKAPIELPVRTNQIPRHIPDQPWYMKTTFTVLMGGILPFGAVFIELFFILTSLWLNRYYYVFGFLLIVFCILVVTCAEITIVMIYFQLCSEDYHWWWRSYLTAGSSGGYLFLYSIFYFFTSSFKMQGFVPLLIFYGYMGVISYIFSVMTGTMGFLACFMFVKKIYGSIKID